MKELKQFVLSNEKETQLTLTQLSQQLNINTRRLSEALSALEAVRWVRRQARSFVFFCNKDISSSYDQLIDELRRRSLKADFKTDSLTLALLMLQKLYGGFSGTYLQIAKELNNPSWVRRIKETGLVLKELGYIQDASGTISFNYNIKQQLENNMPKKKTEAPSQNHYLFSQDIPNFDGLTPNGKMAIQSLQKLSQEGDIPLVSPMPYCKLISQDNYDE